jgi:hypothetical protein
MTLGQAIQLLETLDSAGSSGLAAYVVLYPLTGVRMFAAGATNTYGLFAACPPRAITGASEVGGTATPSRAMSGKLQVLQRGSDVALAEHYVMAH